MLYCKCVVQIYICNLWEIISHIITVLKGLAIREVAQINPFEKHSDLPTDIIIHQKS